MSRLRRRRLRRRLGAKKPWRLLQPTSLLYQAPIGRRSTTVITVGPTGSIGLGSRIRNSCTKRHFSSWRLAARAARDFLFKKFGFHESWAFIYLGVGWWVGWLFCHLFGWLVSCCAAFPVGWLVGCYSGLAQQHACAVTIAI